MVGFRITDDKIEHIPHFERKICHEKCILFHRNTKIKHVNRNGKKSNHKMKMNILLGMLAPLSAGFREWMNTR